MTRRRARGRDVDRLLELAMHAAVQNLVFVAGLRPNERVPKEEQLRCAIYAALLPSADHVLADAAYFDAEHGDKSECDLKVRSGPQTLWVEVKRAWEGAGLNNKPAEQYGTWRTDLGKLAKAPDRRAFVLFGCLDSDPAAATRLTTTIRRIDGEIEILVGHRARTIGLPPIGSRGEHISNTCAPGRGSGSQAVPRVRC